MSSTTRCSICTSIDGVFERRDRLHADGVQGRVGRRLENATGLYVNG